MTEKLNGSTTENMGKLKSEKSKELLKRYERQREQYYKTKNKNNYITEEQRKNIDAEMNAKINELYQQEKAKKQEAITEISGIQEGLNEINTSNVENLNIQNFEFNNNIGFGSIQAITEQAQLYVSYNEEIHKKAEDLSTLYNQFLLVVNRFNKEREEDTRWSGDSDYEKYVDTINQKIQTFKQLFIQAESKLTTAVENSDKAGERLNNAPDDLRKIEGTNQTGTEGQFKKQQDGHISQINAYTEQGQRLQQGSENLSQAQQFLNIYQNQLIQATNTLNIQKTEVDRTLLDRDNKKASFRNKINSICAAANVTPFSDEELKLLQNNPENFIQNIKPQERGQAALNIIQSYNQDLAEYIQIIDKYKIGITQRNQILQGIEATQNRQIQVEQSQQQVTNEQGMIKNEIVANTNRIENVEGEMAESKDEYEKSVEYYHQNMDDIDMLDYEMSSIILDNDLTNSGILETVASQKKSFDGMKVSAKGWGERARDSTIGILGKGLRNYIIEPIKDAFLYLPNLIQKLGEDNPKIGENRLFKVINAPLQIQAGITEGVLELTEGLIQMVEQPIATLEGLGQLIGRDATTGERSRNTAGDSRLNFGKAMIAYDERGEGNDGRALGKTIANIGTLFIPFAGEAGAAVNTAKVARTVGKVSRTRAVLAGAYDFTTRVGGKFANGTKGLARTIRHPVRTLKTGLGYVSETGKNIIKGTIKKGKTVISDVNEAGGVTNYVKQGVSSVRQAVSDTYHSAGGIKGMATSYLEIGTGYAYAKGVYRLIKGEPLFGKKFPSLKKLHTERIKMEERLQKLKGPKGSGGELESMYQKVSKYVDKNGDLLENIAGTDIPISEWKNIAEYQSALQEVRALEATIRQYKQVETSLVDEAGNPTKLGKFIQENEKFGKTLEKMLAEPEKAEEIFAKFKKENPNINLSELEDIEIFKDGENIFRIKNGELVKGEGTKGNSSRASEGEGPEGNRGNSSRASEGEGPEGNRGNSSRASEGEGPEGNRGNSSRASEGEGPEGKMGDFAEMVDIEGTNLEAKVGERTIQNVFDDLAEGKIDVKTAKREIANSLHPDKHPEARGQDALKARYDKLFRNAWDDLDNVINKQPQKYNRSNVSTRGRETAGGMNDYFKEHVTQCEGKDLYIDGNKYTVVKTGDGSLHLTYTGGKKSGPKRANGEPLQQDITVSSFDQLKTNRNASPISDGRAISGSKSAKANQLTQSEARNVEFWNELWEEEKERTRKNAPKQGEKGIDIANKEGSMSTVIEEGGSVPAVIEEQKVNLIQAERIRNPIPEVPHRVSGAILAILTNKDNNQKIKIDVPGTTGFEWTPKDQQEVSKLQELLKNNPSPEEIKSFIRENKDVFKKLVLVKDGDNSGANVNFDILNGLTEQGKFIGIEGNIQEQLKHDIIKYIGLGDLLENGTTFTVTSIDGTKRTGKIINNRAVDENGKYIPIFQGDHIESDALGFLDQIYSYDNETKEINPDDELDNKLKEI